MLKKLFTVCALNVWTFTLCEITLKNNDYYLLLLIAKLFIYFIQIKSKVDTLCKYPPRVETISLYGNLTRESMLKLSLKTFTHCQHYNLPTWHVNTLTDVWIIKFFSFIWCPIVLSVVKAQEPTIGTWFQLY